MPVSSTAQTAQEIVRSGERFKRLLLLLIVVAVAPVGAVAFWMARTFAPSAAMWQWGIGGALVLSLAGTAFLGVRLANGVFGTVVRLFRSEQRLRRLMEMSGDWYWRQDEHQVLRSIIFQGKEQASSVKNSTSTSSTPVPTTVFAWREDEEFRVDSNYPEIELPFVDLARSEVEGLKLIDKRFDWDSFNELMDNRLPFDRVLFEYWPEGRYRLIFESTGRPIFPKGGGFEGYVGVSSNVTQKRLNEQLLSLQRFLLQGVLLSAPIAELTGAYARGLRNCLMVHAEVFVGYRTRLEEPVWRVRSSDPNLKIPPLLGNDVWENPEKYCVPLQGYDKQGLIWLGLMRPDAFGPLWNEMNFSSAWVGMKKSMDSDQPEYWVLVAQRLGARPLEDDVSRILMAIRLLGLCIERRMFEDELQSVNANLEQRIEQRTAELVRSNSELEAFTYTVSHDLRAPLRAIHGFARILQEDYQTSLPENVQGLLERISKNTQHMGSLIDSLLNLSRLLRTSLTYSQVNLKDMLVEVLEQLNASSRAEIQVDDLPVVQADAMLLQQVWMNLLDNALKFSSKSERPKVVITCSPYEKGWIFSVKDNGAGFDMKYAERLFNVFERLHSKSEFEGTGVGLAIVKRIVERHGGTIRAVGEVGQGAEFIFSLNHAESMTG